MELDTGASLSLFSKDTYKSICNVTDQLKPTNVFPLTYTQVKIGFIGSIYVQVEYKSQVLVVPLIVVKCQSPNLFR